MLRLCCCLWLALESGGAAAWQPVDTMTPLISASRPSKHTTRSEWLTLAVPLAAEDGGPQKATGTLNEEIGVASYNAVAGFADSLITINKKADGSTDARQLPVRVALERLQKDMQMLDRAAEQQPQLTNLEVVVLASTVAISAVSPWLVTVNIAEVLVPSMSALSAAIGFSSEYAGKVEVARGKEVAAVTLQAAAEAEVYLAQAERTKAVVPLCVGIATTFSAFALLASEIFTEFATNLGVQVVTEVYLFCPVIAVLAAAIASLATEESVLLCSRAVGVGARRFASSSDVGRTWLSATEQITSQTSKTRGKWQSFVFGVLPAPVFAVLAPGALNFKCIIAAAVAASQAAYSLARVEYALARAVDAVALKSRCAAMSDTYANQGARAGAILPFTSALSGLCAALTVAVVEVVPFFDALAVQSAVSVTFPLLGAVIAAAASISKARCEVDATAATAVASQIASTPIKASLGGSELAPFRSVAELIRLLLRPTVNRVLAVWRRLRFRLLTPKDRLLAARNELQYQFDLVDTNNDGRLSAAEVQNVITELMAMGITRKIGLFKSSPERVARDERARRVIRAAADITDEDGFVSFDQFRQIMETEWREYGPPSAGWAQNSQLR